MNGALLILVGVVCFTLAYLFYSRFIARAIGIDPSRPTPAHEMGDGVDYVPAHPMVLYGHHFATIAGAGPIVGPVLAAEFGWAAVALDANDEPYKILDLNARSFEAAEPELRDTVKLKTLLTYVKEHYGEKQTVADAARLVGYSEAHFMRLFHQETGQTFVAFLNEYRLTAAAYFLRESSKPIGEIAAHCGFDNFSYFIRLFRRRFGVPPREYRHGS